MPAEAARFTWEEELRVHAEDLAVQHQRLFTLLQNFCVSAGRSGERAAASALLRDIIQYTRIHFADEEQFMFAHDYPGLTAHQIEHERLLTQVLTLQREFEAGRLEVNADVAALLESWFDDHVKTLDREYADYFNNRGLNAT